MGRTIPSWRIVLNEKLIRLAGFRQFLRSEDRIVFDDLVAQCRLYASAAGTLASTIKEIPLLMSLIFAQYKRLMKLEKHFNERPGQV